MYFFQIEFELARIRLLKYFDVGKMDDTEPLQRSFDKNDEETPAQDEQLIRNDLVDGKWGIAIVIGAFLINFICKLVMN